MAPRCKDFSAARIDPRYIPFLLSFFLSRCLFSPLPLIRLCIPMQKRREEASRGEEARPHSFLGGGSRGDAREGEDCIGIQVGSRESKGPTLEAPTDATSLAPLNPRFSRGRVTRSMNYPEPASSSVFGPFFSSGIFSPLIRPRLSRAQYSTFFHVSDDLVRPRRLFLADILTSVGMSSFHLGFLKFANFEYCSLVVSGENVQIERNLFQLDVCISIFRVRYLD